MVRLADHLHVSVQEKANQCPKQAALASNSKLVYEKETDDTKLDTLCKVDSHSGTMQEPALPFCSSLLLGPDAHAEKPIAVRHAQQRWVYQEA